MQHSLCAYLALNVPTTGEYKTHAQQVFTPLSNKCHISLLPYTPKKMNIFCQQQSEAMKLPHLPCASSLHCASEPYIGTKTLILPPTASSPIGL
jgi:hypothetical protein